MDSDRASRRNDADHLKQVIRVEVWDATESSKLTNTKNTKPIANHNCNHSWPHFDSGVRLPPNVRRAGGSRYRHHLNRLVRSPAGSCREFGGGSNRSTAHGAIRPVFAGALIAVFAPVRRFRQSRELRRERFAQNVLQALGNNKRDIPTGAQATTRPRST